METYINWSMLNAYPWWVWVLLTIYLLWVMFYMNVAYTMFTKNLPAYTRMSPEDKKNYFMFMRPEIPHITSCKKISMILCGLTLTPFRFAIWFSCVAFINISMRILLCCDDLSKPLSCWKRYTAWFIQMFFSRIMLFMDGYFWITTIKLKIEDYDPDYVKPSVSKRPCVLISNHISLIEGHILSQKFCPSYISRHANKNIFIIGKVIELQQSIFVKRTEKNDRKRLI